MSLQEAYDFRTEQLIALLESVEQARRELACLIPLPSRPMVDQWPCENSADRECLQDAYVRLRDAELDAFQLTGDA
jgi:hypothetical protein